MLNSALLHYHPLAQAVGFVAVCCTFALFQFNDRKKMLVIGLCGAALYCCHFWLLGATTGSAMNLISFLRQATFLKYGRRKRPTWVMYAFIIMFVSMGMLSWQGPISLLPIIGMTTGTVAFWQLKPRRIRRIALISPPCWFIYNLVVGSYPGLLAEIINFSSNSLAIYRFDIKPTRNLYIFWRKTHSSGRYS